MQCERTAPARAICWMHQKGPQTAGMPPQALATMAWVRVLPRQVHDGLCWLHLLRHTLYIYSLTNGPADFIEQLTTKLQVEATCRHCPSRWSRAVPG